jgi:hypothetical protein
MEKYTCPVHKVEQEGKKRETFEKELFEALLEASMEFSYRLYRDVKHGCHCPTNYKSFDTILQDMKIATKSS